MPQMIVNGQPVEFGAEKNILEVVKKAGIELPTFCYQAHLTPFGACRMCVVDAGKRGLLTSCTAPPEDNLEIRTHTDRTLRVRKMALELMLAAHDRDCLTCHKSGECKLQDYSERLGIDHVRFDNKMEHKEPIDNYNPSIIRDPNKCILCGACVRMCLEHQGLHIIDFANRGSNVEVAPAYGMKLHEVECIFCGQCTTVCPTGALMVKADFSKVFKALGDPNKKVVFQVAPSVRVGIGEFFGLEPGVNCEGKIVSALRAMGAHAVFDTNFAADLTIMEEATEFLKRLEADENLPIFTSCCPGWVKTAEHNHPELLANLSSCRSPQQMFASVIKKYYAEDHGLKTEDIFSVSVMPCSAKKFEAQREEFSTNGHLDTDVVITTHELAKMIRAYGLDFHNLPDGEWEKPYGESTGAGVIFGASGGVAEAALRTAYKALTGEELERDVWETAAAGVSHRETAVTINGTEIRIATVNGMAAAERLIAEIKENKKKYHLVEVMACPGGCIGGAGNVAHDTLENRAKRAKGLATIDKVKKFRQSHNNEDIKTLYSKHLVTPNSDEAHHALHTHFSSRRRIEETITLGESAGPVEIRVCVGTCCFQNGSYDVMQKLSRMLKSKGLLSEVDLKATFCFENCTASPNLSVNGKVIGNATAGRLEEIFDEEIIPAFPPAVTVADD